MRLQKESTATRQTIGTKTWRKRQELSHVMEPSKTFREFINAIELVIWLLRIVMIMVSNFLSSAHILLAIIAEPIFLVPIYIIWFLRIWAILHIILFTYSIYYSVIILCIDNCVPYSQEVCEAVAKYIGKKFQEGDYVTKGCYGYESGQYKYTLWYGTGGTEEGKKSDLTGETFRPQGYDCKGKMSSLSV